MKVENVEFRGIAGLEELDGPFYLSADVPEVPRGGSYRKIWRPGAVLIAVAAAGVQAIFPPVGAGKTRIERDPVNRLSVFFL